MAKVVTQMTNAKRISTLKHTFLRLRECSSVFQVLIFEAHNIIVLICSHCSRQQFAVTDATWWLLIMYTETYVLKRQTFP